jgi:serine phosphatase RsbU (regulator of sigma subunit)/DNA-directed RNA polymerase subunit N (RpoN/RPB10)/ketosteroid isomerase-like protein
MRLNKKLEQEVLKRYEAYFENYIKGNAEAISSMLDEDYNQIGSAESEVFFNKKDAVKFLYDTIDQVAGKTEIRNRILKVEPVEELILVTDLFDIYALIENDWSFYSKFRASTLMQKKNDGWKFIHQHSSMPDTRTQDGENIAIEKISAENLQLRDAIKRRTIELENKNRDLEIETSLERVRAIALSMKEPSDMRDVCKTISLQLQSLGVKEIRNVQTALFYEQRGNYMNYEYYAKHKKTLVTETVFTNNKTHKAFAAKMLKGKGEFFITHIKGKKVKEWIAYQKTTNVFVDKYLNKASSLNYYWYSLGPVALGISTYSPLSEDDLQIFNRFRNVFELAYRRFIDIEQAESQAREAQIELALERVRARTMAMHESEELGEISFELVKHVQSLGIATWHCAFNIYDKDQNSSTEWGSNAGGTYPKYKTPREGIFLKYFELGQKGETFHIEVIGEDKCSDHYTWLCTLPGVGDQLLKLKDSGIPFPSSQIDHVAYFKYGYVIFITYEPAPKAYDIFKRFAKVFEQTYIRFLDLQKAEAQTREAQIETALERVRSRTMGMQKSEDLKEVIQAVYEQFVHLNIHIEHTGFIMDYKARDDMHIWLADMHEVPSEVTIPYFDCAHWNSFNEAKERGTDFFTNHLTFEEKNRFYQDLFKLIPWVPEETLEYYFSCPGLAISTVLLENVGLYIENFSGIPYSDEENNTLMRFGKVFQQTYTRFLDLQKAEEQTRESQIELGLERVRARAMAMQNSNELSELVDTVFKELTKLDFALSWCIINIIDESSSSNMVWAANPNIDMAPDSYHMKFEDYPFHDAMMKGYKERENKYIYVLEGLEKKVYDEYLFTETEFRKVPEEAQAASRAMGKYVCSFTFSNFGGLQTVGDEPLSDINLEILERFGKVFDLTYTRFNDLLKAEAQAREAQIEVALERARTQSMLMQHSDELNRTSQVFHEQLQILGVDSEFSYLWLPDEKKGDHLFWATWQDDQKHSTGFNNRQVAYPLDKTEPSIAACFVAWESGDVVHLNYVAPTEVEDYFATWSELLHGIEKFNPELFAEGLYYVDAYMKYGCFGIVTRKLLTKSEQQILSRFTKEFERAYSRFLGLQKAESQARESQIEVALERVRASAMAMHKSEDLTSAVTIVFSELDQLGFNTIRCGIGIFNDNSRNVNVWTASSTGVQLSGDEVLEGHPLLEGIYNAWQNQLEYSYVLKGKELLDYYEVVAESNLPVSGPEMNNENVTQFYYVVNFPAGGLFAFRDSEFNDEVKQLMKRFGDVFNLAFTRHLDIKQAEAQAREAQIEASLEKVRSKAMGMHSSEDLALTIDHFFQELKNLNVKAIRCGVGIKDGDARIVDVTVTSATVSGDDIKLTGKLRLTGHPILENIYEALQLQVEYFPVLHGKEIKEYYKVMNPDIEFPNFSEDDVQYGYYFHYKEGGLFAWTTKELLEEEIHIFRRFKSVLSLTYRRYLDLKDAEAKTKEALIETGLERVRARTMAMHKSTELAQTAAHLFEQLNDLGIKPYRCNIAIVDAEYHRIKLWSTTNSGNVIPTSSSIPLDEYSVFSEMYEGWKTQKVNHTIKIEGENRVAWTKYISKYVPFDEYKSINFNKKTLLNETAIFSNFYFQQGFFVIHTQEQIDEIDLNIIQRFANVFEQTYTRFRDLENAELQNKIIQAENERKTQELEEARELQLSMLPKELPQLKNYEIAVYMQTATEVGGDYYDFNVDEDGTLTTVVGDATGHGMRAGTIVTITKSLFNSLGSEPNILETFKKVSQVIKDMKFRQLSMCLMMLKISSNKLLLSSAAMPPALIYRKNEKTVEEIVSNGMPLGAMVNFPYKLRETQVKTGDTIFLMSDGFPELMNENKNMYGYEKVKSEFQSIAEKSPNEIIDSLKASASEWLHGNDPDDDITFVVIKIK